MDPLHPLVPIEPPPPAAPKYNRVERIERDGQRESAPDWRRGSDEEPDEGEQEQYEDDYDPNWSDPTAVEPYGADGSPHDAAAALDLNPEKRGDPRAHHERRSRPRDQDDGADPSGGHIDVSA